MRLIDLAGIFIIVIIMAAIPVNLGIDKRIEAEQIKRSYNSAIDSAVRDAASVLIESNNSESAEILANGLNDNYEKIELNRDRALNKFYETMFINMNVSKDKINQEILKKYVPIKIIVGYDAYYINTLYEINDEHTNKHEIKEKWMPGKKYVFFDKKNNLGIYFSLADYTVVNDYNTGKINIGSNEELNKLYPISVFGTEFNNIRKSAIIENIKNDLTYFTYLNSEIAKNNGWRYSFEIPVIDNRAIDNISFIAFVQGLPISGTENLNTYGFGVSKIVNTKHYYGNEIKGRKYYHRKNCSLAQESDKVFDTKEEAAKAGYYPCENCRP